MSTVEIILITCQMKLKVRWRKKVNALLYVINILASWATVFLSADIQDKIGHLFKHEPNISNSGGSEKRKEIGEGAIL